MKTRTCGEYVINVPTEEELNDMGGSCLLPDVVQGRKSDYVGISHELTYEDITLLNNSLLDFPKPEQDIINENLLNYKVK